MSMLSKNSTSIPHCILGRCNEGIEKQVPTIRHNFSTKTCNHYRLDKITNITPMLLTVVSYIIILFN